MVFLLSGKKAYKPYKLGETFPDNPPGMCAKTGKS
jgi:cytochrome c-L